MQIQPPTAPLPPLLAALRRRDPDVDIVVLPEQPAESGAAPLDETAGVAPLDETAVAAVLAEVSAQATALAGEPADAVLGYGSEPGTVRVRARVALPASDGSAVTALRDRLAAGGWRVRRLEGAPRLVASREGLHLRASYAETRAAVLLDLSTAPLLVGARLARELVRG